MYTLSSSVFLYIEHIQALLLINSNIFVDVCITWHPHSRKLERDSLSTFGIDRFLQLFYLQQRHSQIYCLSKYMDLQCF